MTEDTPPFQEWIERLNKQIADLSKFRDELAARMFYKPANGAEHVNGDAMESAVKAAKGRTGRIPDPNSARQKIIMVLKKAPDRGLTQDQILQRLEKAGAKLARGQLSPYLAKLATNDKATGRYRLAETTPEK